MNKQITLSAVSDELAQAKTRKKEFLRQMERIIPWKAWEELVKPHYIKESAVISPTNLSL
jgi:IS5 family transposase